MEEKAAKAAEVDTAVPCTRWAEGMMVPNAASTVGDSSEEYEDDKPRHTAVEVATPERNSSACCLSDFAAASRASTSGSANPPAGFNPQGPTSELFDMFLVP